jgi:hypothetical protein
VILQMILLCNAVRKRSVELDVPVAELILLCNIVRKRSNELEMPMAEHR